MGDAVVATSRPASASALEPLQSKYSSNALIVVPLDLKAPENIPAAFARAKDAFGRINIVFNNAGITAACEIETTPDEVIHNLFDTNFFGSMKVSREAVRFFREENPSGIDGRLLVVSSFVGLVPVAMGGYYAASKHGK